MKQAALLLLLLNSVVPMTAQDTLPVFGKPRLDELNMKTCSFDPHANALKLLDYQEIEVVGDYVLKFKTERRVRIKIFNEKGFKYASITIPYNSKNKGIQISDISAYIHYINDAGKIHTEKLDNKQIFRDKDQFTRSIKFTFPNVKAGCVIEYRYEKIDKNPSHLDPWLFQDLIPTQYSCFRLKLPSTANLEYRLRGIDSIDASVKSMVDWVHGPPILDRKFALSNIPSFKPEPMMTSASDNLQRIEFAFQSRRIASAGADDKKWKIFTEQLNEWEVFGGQYNKSIPGTERIIDSALKMASREEKIHYIFQRVKSHVKWDEIQTFYPGNIADAWKERSGNSAEINMLVLNLLRKSGIKCSPILVSTRDNGLVDAGFVSISQFNGLDVLVTDPPANYVLDATQKHQSYKTPPSNILNRHVLNIDNAGSKWVFITDSKPLLKTMLFVNAELTGAGKIVGNATITSYDHSKSIRLEGKNETGDDEPDDEKEFIRKDFTELKIDSFITEFAEDDLSPLTESFVFTYEPSSTDDFMFLDPFFLSNFRKNPFTDSLRRTSLDFNSIQLLMTTVNIQLPENYEITNLPKNVRMRMADSSILFTRTTSVHNHTIHFSNQMEVLRPMFEKEDYDAIRDFFAKMYGLITEQIILKKK
jgi:hypothetical protein